MASPSKKAKVEVDDPLVLEDKQVLPLTATILPKMDSNALLNYLLEMPNGTTVPDVIEELCTKHEFKPIFLYLNSLPYSHWHRRIMKKALSDRFRDMTVADLHQLGQTLIPLKSALTVIDGESVAVMGPHTDLDAAAWDTSDWFFHMLHERRMEGEPTLLFDIPLPIYIRARLCFEAE